MSIKLMTHVWDHSPHHGTTLLMLLALADHANDDGLCWPSVPRLAARCRISERQAISVLQALEKAGDITIERGCGRGHASLYHVKGEGDFTLSKKGEIQRKKGEVQRRKGEVAISPESPLEPPEEPKSEPPNDRSAQGGGEATILDPSQLAPAQVPEQIRLTQCDVNCEGIQSLFAKVWPAEAHTQTLQSAPDSPTEEGENGSPNEA